MIVTVIGQTVRGFGGRAAKEAALACVRDVQKGKG